MLRSHINLSNILNSPGDFYSLVIVELVQISKRFGLFII